jgi:hypothetical protein
MESTNFLDAFAGSQLLGIDLNGMETSTNPIDNIILFSFSFLFIATLLLTNKMED